MAPRTVSRKSTPAFANGTTLTPSRRSPRVPATTKAADSARSSKTLDIASSPAADDIRYYYPKTPPSSKPLSNSSPELPSSRRRIFQARPSRLSHVYTPVVDRANSSSQESRNTRHITAIDTPTDLLSDKDVAENIGLTGWTYDQYMGGLDATMEPPSPSAASSKGTRSSARLRKPTTRAIEAQELEKKPRRKSTAPAFVSSPAHASTPAPAPAATHVPTHSPTHVADLAPTAAATAAAATSASASPTPAPPSTKDVTSDSVAQGSKKTTRKSIKGKKKKPLKQRKSQLRRIEIDIETAGRKLYEAALEALTGDFTPPPDPQWTLATARFAYSQAKNGVQRTRVAPAGDENQPNLYDSDTDAGSTGKFKQTAEPRVESDGWSYIGRINDSGEELMIPPSGHDIYCPFHLYGYENLPWPPVRSRSEQQALNDRTFGYPPLIGDRNIPFDNQSQFMAEDITEEKARAQARDEARQRAADAPIETRKPRAAKRRQSAPASKTELPATAGNEEPETETKPKRRRGGARASLPTTGAAAAATATTAKSGAVTKTLKSKATKSRTKKAAPEPVSIADNNEEGNRPPIRLKLKFTRPQDQLNTPEKTNAPQSSSNVPQSTETPRTGKGKKRGASSIDDAEFVGNSSVKRARKAPSTDLEYTPKTARRATTRKATPSLRAREQAELSSGEASPSKPKTTNRTPKNSTRATSPPASRSRARNRARNRD